MKNGTDAEDNGKSGERLLTIQNAANLQWPADMAGNETGRGQFRLGLFPSKRLATAKKVENKPPGA